MFKPLSIILTTIFLAACGPIKTTTPSSELQFDFRGLTMSSNPTTEMISTSQTTGHNHSRVKTYRKVNEQLSFGNIKVQSIDYSYFDNSLYSIEIYIGHDSTCSKTNRLSQMIEHKYKLTLQKQSSDFIEFMHIYEGESIHFSISCNKAYSSNGTRAGFVMIQEKPTNKIAQQYEDNFLNTIIQNSVNKGSKDF